MKKLIAVIGIVMIVGCASTTPDPEVAVVEASEIAAPTLEVSREQEVLSCVNTLMEQQAHVMDATKACTYIFGLDKSRDVRTTDL